MNDNKIKQSIETLSAGCSGLSWISEDQKHFWGRNFDFNRIASDSKITFVPSGTTFYACGTAIEKNLDESTKLTSSYGVLGMGSLILKTTPTFFEGINEKGLMGGQLYYREFAKYADEVKEGTIPLQPIFAVTYFLSMCATVEEVISKLENDVTLIAKPVFGDIRYTHWMFSDRTGETIIIEPDVDKLKIHRHSMGVLTNSPNYDWHRTNLLNYCNIRSLDYSSVTLNDDTIEACFSGSGAAGLPGDFSSPSRFTRLAFLKNYACKGKNEIEAVTYMFQTFKNVQFPMGIVEVGEDKTITEHDSGVVLFDYTIYTAVMCAESLRYYWVSYQNMRIQCVDMNPLIEKKQAVQFELNPINDIKYLN